MNSVNEISPTVNAITADKPEGEGKMTKKRKESRPRVTKKLNNSKVLKKAKKSINKLELEVAEKRGYTMCLKQSLMEEAAVMEGAIQEMETKLARLKTKKDLHFARNECMEQFITRMLAIFEAEDHLD